MMRKEEWRPVLGYEGRYEVSDLGRVRSMERWRSTPRNPNRQQIIRGRVLATNVFDKDGYPVVSMSGGTRAHKKRCATHWLVAEAFIGPRPEAHLVLHKDDNKSNNTLGNLYYGVHADNGKDMVRNGTVSRGEKRYNSVLTEKAVRQIRNLRPHMSLHALGKMFGVSHGVICGIMAGRAWKHVE